MRILITLLLVGFFSLLSAQPKFFLTGNVGPSWFPGLTPTASQNLSLGDLSAGPPLTYSLGVALSYKRKTKRRIVEDHLSLSFGRANVRDFTTTYSRDLMANGALASTVVAQATLQSVTFLDLKGSILLAKLPWLKGLSLSLDNGFRYLTGFQTHLSIAQVDATSGEVRPPGVPYRIKDEALETLMSGTGVTLEDKLLNRFNGYTSLVLTTTERKGRVTSLIFEGSPYSWFNDDDFQNGYDLSNQCWFSIKFGVWGRIF